MISIVVIGYNIERYIEKCVCSVMRQMEKDVELILVNDGSTDSTGNLCDKLAQENNGVVTIHKSNGGQNSARIAGTNMASGNYIMFVDGDDWIDVKCIKRIKQLLNEYPDLDLICFDMKVVSKKGEHISPFGIDQGYYSSSEIERCFYPRLIEDDKGRHIVGSLCGKVFRKEKLIPCFNSNNTNIRIGEDAAVVRPYIFTCKSIYVLNEPLYYYNRTNEVSTTKVLKPLSINNTIEIRKGLIRVFGYRDPWKYQINRNTIHNMYITCLSRFNSSKKCIDIRKDLVDILDYNWGENIYDNCEYKSIIWKVIVYSMKHHFTVVFFILWKLSKLSGN